MKTAIRFLMCAFALIPIVVSGAPSAEPVIRTAIAADNAVPGQAIELTVTVLVPTWMTDGVEFPTLELPNVMVRIPPEASYATHETVGRVRWPGVAHRYELLPMTAGTIVIPSRSINIVYAHPDTGKPTPFVLMTEEKTVEVTLPPGAEGLQPFIAATALSLEQVIEGTTERLEPGNVFKRIVTARIEGGSPFVIPTLIPELRAEGLSEYPDAPVIKSGDPREELPGERIESVTYVAAAGGDYIAPAIEIEWYRLDTETIETARIEGFDIGIRRTLLGADGVSRDAAAPLMFFAAGVVLFVMLYGGRCAEIFRSWRQRREANYVASERYAYRALTRAVDSRNIGDTLGALEQWTARLPRGNGEAEESLLGAMQGIGAARYGPARESQDEVWPALSGAIRKARRDRLERQADDRGSSPLPPLNPASG